MASPPGAEVVQYTLHDGDNDAQASTITFNAVTGVPTILQPIVLTSGGHPLTYHQDAATGVLSAFLDQGAHRTSAMRGTRQPMSRWKGGATTRASVSTTRIGTMDRNGM